MSRAIGFITKKAQNGFMSLMGLVASYPTVTGVCQKADKPEIQGKSNPARLFPDPSDKF